MTSLGFDTAYWFLESIRDVVLFEKGTFLERFFLPDPMTFWMRLLVICILVLFGVYTQSIRARMIQHKQSIGRPMRDVSILAIGSAFSAGYWILEAFRDVFIHEEGSLVDQILHPNNVDF